VIIATDLWTIIPVIVGAATAVAGVLTWFINGVRTERTRLQKLYADAYSAVVSYQEFPFLIKRRRAPTPDSYQIGGEERLRISGALHAVQEALNNYGAQISMESNAVSAKYSALVKRTREVAGGYMHDAWKDDPLDNDPGMNMHLDYSSLEQSQDEYLSAVKHDMSFWPVALPRLRKKTPQRVSS
jgi:hypothetical protein